MKNKDYLILGLIGVIIIIGAAFSFNSLQSTDGKTLNTTNNTSDQGDKQTATKTSTNTKSGGSNSGGEDGPGNPAGIYCPKCGSDNWESGYLNETHVPYRCLDCGYQWIEEWPEELR
ncbi:MAG: hypothetical protein FJ150_09730 [Euryarchaeota archaeon]|nr:hypothetical protein [Euryarchaeota archaeon]